MTASPPPRLADWLLDRLTSGGTSDSLVGDLHEQFGRGRSIAWYWRQATIAIALEMVMKQGLLWILVPTIAAAGLTATLSYRFMPPRYQTETLILVVPPRVPDAYVRPTLTTRINDRLPSIRQQVLSRTRLERIIQDLNLYPEERKVSTMEDVVERMRSNIDVQIVRNDSFRVSFTADNPRTAVRVTQRLTSLFIDENLRDRETFAEGTERFLGDQAEDMRNQIVEQEARLQHLRATTSGELSQADLLPYEVLKESYKSLLQKRLEAVMAANLERRLIGEQFKLLDPARLPQVPLGPSKAAINVGGTVAGLGLGLVMLVVAKRQKKTQEPTGAEEIL
jgi:uncharacterized protein involved in exopolysaccharide biosynthesis